MLFDPAGNLTHENAERHRIRYKYSNEGRLSEIRTDEANRPPTLTTVLNDSRQSGGGVTPARTHNRLTETRDGELTSYQYRPNAAGHPQLHTTTEGPPKGPVTRYFFDPAGNLGHENAERHRIPSQYENGRGAGGAAD